MSRNIKNSPLHFIGGAIQALGAYDWGGKRKAKAKEAQGEYDAMRQKFMDREFTNLYGDVSNPYANMENTMEDLTVNQQQAQFEAQQGAQTRANVMGQMRGAAGSSGVAGLAQAMANQGQQAAQRASASIGQQEAANQKAAAQQAGQLQTMDRQGAWKADMTRRSGAEQQRQLEVSRENTLFAMSADRLASAEQAVQQGQDAMWSGIGSSVGEAAQLAMLASDIRLKENITKTGVSKSGIPIYTFNYKGEDQLWSGTMAQDLLEMGKNDAVAVMDNGYYGVYYRMIDVDMIAKN
jgi:hypothetical protein|tara:strand:+ start:3316 stop:4197 length:882 start_codon:yes stop_codon:yes gene_type:complete